MPNTLRYRNSDFYNVANQEATVFKSFAGVVSGTGGLTVWTPASGKKFVVKGFAIGAVVATTLTGTATQLHLVDDSYAAANILWPLASYSATAAAGTVLRSPTPTVLPFKPNGFVGSAINRVVKIVCDAAAGQNISVSGVIWGDEV